MDIDQRVQAAEEFLRFRENEILETGRSVDPLEWGEHLRQERIRQLARNVVDPDIDDDVKALIEAVLGE